MRIFYYNWNNDNGIANYFESHAEYRLSEIPDIMTNVCVIFDNNQHEVELSVSHEEVLLIFAHITNAPLPWIEFARAAGQRVELVVMSSESVNPDAAWPTNVHALGYSAINLTGKERVETFFKNLSGAPDWSLLAPLPYPEHLIAFYLVLIAKDRGLTITLPSDIEGKAIAEYEKLKPVHDHKMDFNQEGIHDLFAKMVKI